ncbi:MAG: aldo/keto reductase [Alphaproteobacteria bacterium]
MDVREVKGGAIPLVGYGTYPLTGDAAVRGVAAALEAGYRHIDTAQMYGNEAEVGRALAASGLARDAVFVTTKVLPGNYAPDRFAGTVAESLDALRLDRVDLLLLHWPNPAFSMEKTLELLLAEQDAGRARLVGVSNFEPADLDRAMAFTAGRIVNDQIEFHPLVDRSAEQAAAERHGISLTAYCPVARGAVAQEPILTAIGQAHGKTAAQVALRWAVQQGVIVVPKASSPAHIAANIDVFDFALDADEMARVGALRARNQRLVRVAGLSPTWG